jgi:outer membrane lipoprotein-sorting protein
MRKISPRWIPALLAPTIVASSVFITSTQARAVNLPDKSAAEILAMINTDEGISFSGRVVKKADLGLPPMNLVPDISQSMVDSMKERLPAEMAEFIPEASIEGELALILEFLAGTHNANIYVDGPQRARVQVLDLLSERNFIRNGEEVWFYDAAKSRVVYSKIDPAVDDEARSELELWVARNSSQFPFDITSPSSVADYLIDQADETTNFRVDEDASVAGRDAYQLIMSPQAGRSLFDNVKFAIDAATGLPLSVTVKAVGKADPAFEIAFTSISFERPQATLFAFTPPAGAIVEKVDLEDFKYMGEAGEKPRLDSTDRKRIEKEADRLRAEGWAAVVKIPADEVPTDFSEALRANRLYEELTRSVKGGRVFSTTLFNIFFADDGSIYAGAVTFERLLEAASK